MEMEVIQQKLIWLLGIGSILLMLLKLRISNTLAVSHAGFKIVTGFSLIAIGTVLGIISRLGIFGDFILSSGLEFYIENLLGYLLGWSLIVWGLLEWSNEYYDNKGTMLQSPRTKLFSDKIANYIALNPRPEELLENMSKYLLLALDCQAVALHRKDSDGLRLTFQSGFTPESENLIARPSDSSLLSSAIREKETLVSDNPSMIHESAAAASNSGALTSSLSTPIIVDGVAVAVFSVYDIEKRNFDSDDLKIINMINSALHASLVREMESESRQMTELFRGLVDNVAHSFERGQTLITSTLQAARIIYSHLPFTEINLYISGNGKADKLTFDLPQAGRVKIETGFMRRHEKPHLFTGVPSQQKNGDSKLQVYTVYDRTSVICRISPRHANTAWLEMRFTYLPQNLNELLKAFGQGISQKLLEENIERVNNQAGQWLGALRYYQEKALASNDISGLLHDLANLIVNSDAAAFCRIMLSDPDKTVLKTAALAQVRPLRWSMQQLSGVAVDKTTFHKKALLERTQIEFDQKDSESKIPDNEAAFLLPDGVKSGIITPLEIGGQAVGLLTIGEFREPDRQSDTDLIRLYISDLAALISMILSWHKDKRITTDTREGHKRLTFVQRETVKPIATPSQLAPKIRSRINGPLAGILASCEYLKDNSGVDDDISKFLSVIERNAVKIQEITAGIHDKL
jgi:transcriptional regulator with GAF, ATPase, and Fis domain